MKRVELLKYALFAVVASGSCNAQENFDEQVRDALLRNPEIILEVFALLEQQKDQREQQQDLALIKSVSEQLFPEEAAGEGQAPAVLVEFVDYNCGYCRRAAEEVDALLKLDPNVDLRVLQYPILGEQSVDIARLVYAAKLVYGQDTYLDLNHAVLSGGAQAVNNFEEFVTIMGFDYAALVELANDPRVDAHFEQTLAIARRLNIAGTPGFVTRTAIHRGYVKAEPLLTSTHAFRSIEVVN